MKPLTDLKKLALACAGAAAEKKAGNIVVLDVRKVFSLASYFVICSTESDRQVQAVAGAIEQFLKDHQMRVLGVEGLSDSKWVLMDINGVIIHIFQSDTRLFYDLEGLWRDAPRVPLTSVRGHRRAGSAAGPSAP